MQNKVFQLIFILFPIFSFGQLDISKISDSIYVYTTYQDYNGSPTPANSMYVITDDGIVMIDTPWDKSQLPALLDSMMTKHSLKPIMSISTHYHGDRTNGINYLDSIGVKTFSTAQTQRLCIERGEEIARDTISKDTNFVIGGIAFEIYYPGEGHAPDNIIIYLPNQKVLFGGCYIKSTEATNLGWTGDANIISWYESLQIVRKKYSDVEVVIPGHQNWGGTSLLKHTSKLLKPAYRILIKRFKRRSKRGFITHF